MTNLRKIVLFISTLAMLLYLAIKIGILTMLLAIIILNTVVFAIFVYWSLRPAPAHRNKLQSFNLTFESKRIEFEPTENGLYRVNLCTKHFSEVKARKEDLQFFKNQDGGQTGHWVKMPMVLRKEYFTKDIAVELTDELLTEKQAIKTYLLLLKQGKTKSICNANYISEIIKNKYQPLFLTIERLQKIEKVKLFVKEKLSIFSPLSPLFEIKTKDNTFIVLFLFLISSLDLQAFELEKRVFEFAINSSFDSLLSFIGTVWFLSIMYKRFCDYIKNECIQ